ncbi:hypothetical protein [Hymenobacter ruricola]|uniref:Uncharacterized protein n=1 Tax=Hymenobacter ruricola TaxID=2791023 RepID=A0ABS0I461_9BACT|nr:hypothetical protein [Hymenobacter ruricola]MBF9221339.1 hypothetical protein [Hymenobacter ruricola]
MKKVLLGGGLVLLLAGPLWLIGQPTSNRVAITVSDSDDQFKIVASYNVAQSARIIGLLNDSLRPAVPLSASQAEDTRLLLADRTALTVQAAPGRLRLVADKRTNSAASLNRIHRLVPGLTHLVQTSAPR